MAAAIDANAPLDCIEFHIVPSQNRYEACIYSENKNEKVSSGLLEHLLLYSAEIKALHSEESNAKYTLYAPENSDDLKWFTKATLRRFLHIISSADILVVTNSLKNEISQLEEARRFHLSLYAKDESSDASKNELLRAMDLRLTALRGELATAFNQAAGSRYSVEEMTDLQEFSHHFGSKDLSDALCKCIEMRQGDQAVENTSSSKQFSPRDRVGSKEGNNRTDKSLSSETQVKYGVSPAKVAQVERQSSSESDESSFSSDEERPSVERSRTLVRSASPRRSASPMRRVQIGRSGSRRSTAITIKSLNFIPARERSFLAKDPAASDSDEERPKKSETNMRRMSVQDAINLFESKQQDQKVDIQKAKTLLNASIGANKAVLRRWSSGMGEDSSPCPQDNSVESTEVQNNVENREVRFSSPDFETAPGVATEDYPIETCEENVKLESVENGACSPVLTQEEPRLTESLDVNEKSNASAEWSRQKEAELNELFMKMMDTKPVKSRAVAPVNSKRQSLPSEQRGGFYDNYKEKRDEKLRVEASRKSTEKEKQFRATRQTLDVKKSKLTSANASDDSKKRIVKKLQKPQKSSASQPANPKTESPKLGNVKKDTTKASSVPATRKSWPSIPSATATGLSPSKTPPAKSSTNANATRRRPQPIPSVSHSSSKVETLQTRAKSVKSNQNESKKSLRSDPERKQQSLTKPAKTGKTAKSKVVQTAPNDLAPSTKPNLYSKVTKKSSVVPLESKPFLRKGSKTTPGVNPTVTKKASEPQLPVRNSEDQNLAQESVTFSNSSDPVIHQEQKEIEDLTIHACIELELTPGSPQKCDDKGFSQVTSITDDAIDRTVEPELKSEAEEELTISPRAWVETEDNEDHLITSVDHVVGSPIDIAPVEVTSPRVRHSLSQMLLEESSEPDFVEWGNAENPPPMVYQKDAPKGFKRLLNFARKSKNEANSTGWSSPSVFSEGEDDADDSKLMSKRSAENLLRKATMNNGHQKSSTDYEYPAQANISKLNAQRLSQQFQQGQASASVTTTKATRSFFSLSAFKGSK